MPWHGAVRGLRRAVADQDHVPQPASTRMLRALVRASLRAPGPQAGRQLLAQRPAGLNEERPVDRLVRHAHLQVVRIVADEARRDLLRRPVLQQPTLYFTAQPRMGRQLRRLGPSRARLAAVFSARQAR